MGSQKYYCRQWEYSRELHQLTRHYDSVMGSRPNSDLRSPLDILILLLVLVDCSPSRHIRHPLDELGKRLTGGIVVVEVLQLSESPP